MAARKCGVSILRFVEVSEERVGITDRIRVEKGQLAVSDLGWISGPHVIWLVDTPFEKGKDLPPVLNAGDIYEFRQELQLQRGDADGVEVVYDHSPGLAEAAAC